MKTKTILYSFVISIFFICAKCEHESLYIIKFINESEYSIGYYFAAGGIYGTYYPDSLPNQNDYIVYEMNKEIQSGIGSHLPWNQFFNNLPHDTLSVFIFHTDTLNLYSWYEVRDGYKVLKRYDLSLQDVYDLNYEIYYPPNEKMKNIKMYPPYE
jgi:hypothetical protein